jgi:hypothetical protein
VHVVPVIPGTESVEESAARQDSGSRRLEEDSRAHLSFAFTCFFIPLLPALPSRLQALLLSSTRKGSLHAAILEGRRRRTRRTCARMPATS